MIDSNGNETKTIYEAVLLEEVIGLREELAAVKKQLESFREQLVCEAVQYQEIYNYTNDGKLAVIALDHKERILELLNSEL
jgi:hypothetical protein